MLTLVARRSFANVVPARLRSSLHCGPDFLALVLLYWCIQEPRYVGVGTAWAVGLVMDVADATVFGQHALAYAVLALRGRIFPPPRAALSAVAAGGAGGSVLLALVRARWCCSCGSSAAQRCRAGRT